MIFLIILLFAMCNLVSCKEKDLIIESEEIFESTNDESDRTDEILSIIEEKGYVKLGEGEFVINDLKMKPNSTIEGIGGGRTVIKTSKANSSAIILNTNCTIDNLSIKGLSKSVPESIGESCGLLIDGKKTNTIENIVITRVKIEGFDKAGLYGFETGYECENSLSMSNCEITGCYIGLLIGKYFEYGRYTNILIWNNKCGCVNNAGNNNFVNCTFTKNEIGFKMTSDQANGGHGSCSSCSFNHSNGGTGNAICVEGTKNSFTFSSCQIWFGRIEISNSKGILFSACTLGGGEIFIEGDNKQVFIESSIFQSTPNIEGEGVILRNCYLFSGESII